MARSAKTGKTSQKQEESGETSNDMSSHTMQGMLWRVERLERQVKRLSELVREHASDADRLVQIVAEDREILRQELLNRSLSSEQDALSSSSGSESFKIVSP